MRGILFGAVYSGLACLPAVGFYLMNNFDDPNIKSLGMALNFGGPILMFLVAGLINSFEREIDKLKKGE